MVETGLKAKVKVHPSNKYTIGIPDACGKEDIFIDLYDIGIEYDTIYHSSSNCHAASQDGQKHH